MATRSTSIWIGPAAIENRKSGARIWFDPGDKESAIDLSETAEEILGPLGEIEILRKG
jgi:hypothetical protein